MQKRTETIALIVLPVLIVALVLYNANVMNRYYAIEHGLNQDAKVCMARIMPDRYDITIAPGKTVQLNFALTNEGNFIWFKTGDHPVHLSYHVLSMDKKPIKNENARFDLPQDVHPDEDVKLNAVLEPNLPTGDYILEFDLVEEGVAWFGAKGSPTTLVKLHVKG